MKPDRIKGHLDLLLIGILDDGPGHGYSLIRALRDRTEGTFDLSEGTVYPALHRLEDAGLVASDWQDVGGRRRRVYRLTSDGRDALVVEKRSWRQFTAAIDAVLGGGATVTGSLT
jgi:PadR family transcriptional regulator, regulatory protein PadR